ncbi:hypothetical protein [Psychroflexus maritimus]|uniref:Uncharacterized protein n=1 Tax=Psychroflexus maritimus TaxID=2714865 RepID=A0A967AFE3_9FLAO|nr:hypothetical protein [Psychroflexus maritimus]NGZ90760.1 hypothetical protein [Psychroflexus maritimus]
MILYFPNFNLKEVKERFQHLMKVRNPVLIGILKKQVLEDLFAFEDEYLKEKTSDCVFGVYQLEKSN